ncbi:MAG TPA: sulfatase-like hydrolase/transferase, partial [Acidobacteriota bacterium]
MHRLHIFILFQLAVFHPLFEQLRLSPEFFLANNNSPFDIKALFLLFWLALPLLLIAVVQAISHYSQKAGERAHLIVFALLFLITTFFALNRTTDLTPQLMALTALFLTASITAGYARYHSIRSFFTFLFPIILIPPVLFFSNSFILKLLRAENTFVKGMRVGNQVPVVMIIFDELPLSSLLKANDQIDSARFPNFAKLVDESHWFRNTTTVAGYTSAAVPAILTGRYPEGAKIPMFFDHPQNLFVMLGGSHRIVARETATRLCPGSLCESRIATFRVRFGLLLSQIGILYSHLVLPSAWADRWFPIEDVVNFCKSPEDRAADFTQFFELVGPPSGDLPPFYFTHIQLPHSPWRYLPSGATMNDEMLEALKQEIARQSPARVAELFPLQCHLLQVEFVDRLLGRFLERLRRANLYDPALIIVTSDHGLTRAVNDGRITDVSNISNLDSMENLLVPFFMKLPNQKSGVISDRNVQTIDVLPTIADALGIKVDWTDGASALDESLPERPDRYFYK